MIQLTELSFKKKKKKPREQGFGIFISVQSTGPAFLATHRKSPVNEYAFVFYVTYELIICE